MTVSVTRFATLYSIVYSSERYECNCVVLQPSSSEHIPFICHSLYECVVCVSVWKQMCT